MVRNKIRKNWRREDYDSNYVVDVQIYYEIVEKGKWRISIMDGTVCNLRDLHPKFTCKVCK